MNEIFKKHKEFILYMFFGGCTTIVNILVYYVCTRLINLKTVESTVIAWCMSVLFAYVTNREYVFASNKHTFKDIISEIVSFVGCRLLSGIIDLSIMYVCVDLIGIDDMVIKIISNIIVIVFNYVASKLIVFKK